MLYLKKILFWAVFMKKILTVGLILISIFVMSGCGQSTAQVFTTTNWLDNTTTKGIDSVNEVNTYKVSLTPKNEGANENLSMTIDSTSSYITTLTNTTFNAFYESKDGNGEYNKKVLDCYLFTTQLNVIGSFKVGEQTKTFNDTITTECYFLGVEANLQPLYSKRIVKTHSPIQTDDSYKIEYYDYTLETKYLLSNDVFGDTAVVSFKIGAANEGQFSIEEGSKTFNKIHGKTKTYVDNEMLVLAPRATALSSSTAFTFNSIDAICGINRTFKVGALSMPQGNSLSLTEGGHRYTFDGRVKSDVLVTPLSISIDSEFPGTPYNVFYANPSALDAKNMRGNLIKIENETLYNMGTIVYLATKTTI